MRAAAAMLIVACACSKARAIGHDSSGSSSDTSVTTPAAGAVEIYDAAQLSSIAQGLARNGATGRTFGGQANLHYVESRRVTSGTPEIHDAWTDITIVQSGRAALLSGGRVTGGRLVSSGEHRGGTIAGGTPHRIGVGDVIIVPAGTPHQFQLGPRDSIRYLTLKIANH